MKRILALVLLALLLPSLTGCAGCGCRERLRNCFRRGAICGSRTAPVATAPAPIVYQQPAPVQQVQPQYVQPQYVQPQVPAPAPIVQAPAPRVVTPQYTAPTMPCCPCVPCCPPVYQECCPSYDPCGCGGMSYSVGSPSYDGAWMSSDSCCGGGSYSGESVGSGQPTQAQPDSSTSTDPEPSL